MAPLIWAVIGLALVVSEFFVPGFVVFFFGLGALLNAAVAALFPALGLPLQVVTWLGLSAVSLFALRRSFSRWFRGRAFVDEDETVYIGKSVKVLEEITPEHPGRIRLGGTSWVAESYSESFRPGQRVEILKREGMRFIVTESIMGRLPGETDNGAGE